MSIEKLWVWLPLGLLRYVDAISIFGYRQWCSVLQNSSNVQWRHLSFHFLLSHITVPHLSLIRYSRLQIWKKGLLLLLSIYGPVHGQQARFLNRLWRQPETGAYKLLHQRSINGPLPRLTLIHASNNKFHPNRPATHHGPNCITHHLGLPRVTKSPKHRKTTSPNGKLQPSLQKWRFDPLPTYWYIFILNICFDNFNFLVCVICYWFYWY